MILATATRRHAPGLTQREAFEELMPKCRTSREFFNAHSAQLLDKQRSHTLQGASMHCCSGPQPPD